MSRQKIVPKKNRCSVRFEDRSAERSLLSAAFVMAPIENTVTHNHGRRGAVTQPSSFVRSFVLWDLFRACRRIKDDYARGALCSQLRVCVNEKCLSDRCYVRIDVGIFSVMSRPGTPPTMSGRGKDSRSRSGEALPPAARGSDPRTAATPARSTPARPLNRAESRCRRSVAARHSPARDA